MNTFNIPLGFKVIPTINNTALLNMGNHSPGVLAISTNIKQGYYINFNY